MKCNHVISKVSEGKTETLKVCAKCNKILKRIPKSDTKPGNDLSMKVCEWMSMGKVGISSATMASIALGLKKPVYGTHFGYPYDPADLNRCRILVKHIPEIRDSFKKIGRRVPGFKPILDNWDELIALLDDEVREDTGRAPRTYARMKELLGRHA